MAGNNGASQFSAFAALTGFEDLIEEHNQFDEARRELSEEELQILSDKMQRVKKGMEVQVTHYKGRKHIETKGTATRIDFIYRTIRINDFLIPFDDVINLIIIDK